MHCTESLRLPSSDFLTRLSIIDRNAVRVLPEPVGEHSRRCSPFMILGIAIFCGSVKSGNLSSNQFLTGADRVPRSSSVSILSCMYSISGIFSYRTAVRRSIG